MPETDQSDLSVYRTRDLQISEMALTTTAGATTGKADMKHKMGLMVLNMTTGTAPECVTYNGNYAHATLTNANVKYYSANVSVTALNAFGGTYIPYSDSRTGTVSYYLCKPASSGSISFKTSYIALNNGSETGAVPQWTMPAVAYPSAGGTYTSGTTTTPAFKNFARLYGCTKAAQTYSTPLVNSKYKIECWGAQGGILRPSWTGQGGRGGYVCGTIMFEHTLPLYVYVGGHPIDYSLSGYETGGWNGGGSVVGAAAGAGATDVRVVSGEWNNIPSLCSRIIVAGAGGGADVNIDGGYGGGLTAGGGALDAASVGTAYTSAAATYTNAKGGEQRQGGKGGSTFSYNSRTQIGPDGTFGQGGSDGNVDGGGGSGGYYGGGHSSCPWASGGGGSSFISGHNGCDAIKASVNSLSSISHTGQPNHYTGHIFTSTKMIDGSGKVWTTTQGNLEQMPNPTTANDKYASGTGHTGDGYARITVMPYD